jgi:hypothetical protein
MSRLRSVAPEPEAEALRHSPRVACRVGDDGGQAESKRVRPGQQAPRSGGQPHANGPRCRLWQLRRAGRKRDARRAHRRRATQPAGDGERVSVAHAHCQWLAGSYPRPHRRERHQRVGAKPRRGRGGRTRDARPGGSARRRRTRCSTSASRWSRCAASSCGSGSCRSTSREWCVRWARCPAGAPHSPAPTRNPGEPNSRAPSSCRVPTEARPS